MRPGPSSAPTHAAARVLGIPAVGLQGKNLADFFDPEATGAMLGAVAEVFSSRRSVGNQAGHAPQGPHLLVFHPLCAHLRGRRPLGGAGPGHGPGHHRPPGDGKAAGPDREAGLPGHPGRRGGPRDQQPGGRHAGLHRTPAGPAPAGQQGAPDAQDHRAPGAQRQEASSKT